MAGTEHVEVFVGYEAKVDGRKGWYFRRVSANNRKTASSQRYTRRWSAKRAARRAFPGITITVVK